MRIRKLLLVVTLTVVLLAAILPVSFAAPASVSSPMTEPEPSLSGDNITIYYVVSYNSNSFFGAGTYLYELSVSGGGQYIFCPTFPSGNNSNQRLYLTARDNSFQAVVNTYDVSTGSLLETFNYPLAPGEGGGLTVNSVTGYYNIPWRGGYFPRQSGIYTSNDFEGGYWILPENLQIVNVTYPAALNVEPFVEWSSYPPEHNTYHSHLSEPVADKYNRYLIINDKLYWISFRLNGAYVLKSDIKTDSEVSSYVAEGQAVGSITSGSGLQELVALGSETTYQDKVVYPVSFKSESVFDDKLMYLALYYTNDVTQLRLNIDQYALVKALSTDKLYIDADVYVSTFDLETGSYSSSSYYSLHDYVMSNITITYELPRQIDDIRCYGIDFVNPSSLPVNLSDVLWQYDIEFAGWRDRMEKYLKGIYALLAGEDQEIPEADTYPNWGNELQSAEQNYSDVSPGEFKAELDQALPKGKYDNAASQIKKWVDDFSIPGLISVCIVALALGTVSLTLGKKKSE